MKLGRLFFGGGVLVALALAVLVSPFASGSPDGLEAVAEKQGFAAAAEEHPVDTPLADYAVSGVEDSRVSTAASGAIGLLLTLGLGTALFAVMRRLRPDPAPSETAPTGSTS
jgi:hypothetical protein